MTKARTASFAAAENILGLAQGAFPAEARDRALMAIVDTLGVTLAGAVHDGQSRLARAVLPGTGDGPAAVLGGTRRIGMLDAALLNGTAAHMLDYDDSNSHLFGHVSVAVLPALLALAEQQKASGAQLIHAFICGFETAARFGNTVSKFQYTNGWHPTTTVGLFGAVAACGVLAGLDQRQMAMAIGIATHLASGVKSNFGSMTKPLGVGNANRNALLAVLLAQEGFTSGEAALEHHHGYFNAYNRGMENVDLDALVQPWTGELKILDRKKGIKQKRYPCCYATAPGLDGLLDLRAEHGLTAEDIESIEVAVHPIRFPHINVPDPATPLAAKFSMTYCAARAIVEGRVVMSDFDEGPAFSDAATRALMARSRLVRYTRENPSGADVTIVTRDGRTLTRYVEAAMGSTYDHPMTPQMVREKFLDCAALVTGRDGAVALWEALLALPGCSDLSGMTAQMLRPAAAADRRVAAHG
ncbi:MmgE/PrpD family protein [Xinfangfangia pollutisoli]|uniref:MmgE/PrpD family protein n=1 Tax=Xinfangfangia pollutisoli TaxID=2865960 RepID=UPI001CD7C90B|nr:MmgE/PrpD family protein [Xinfangfangia pollutisoli]